MWFRIGVLKDIGVTTLTFQGHVTSDLVVTITTTTTKSKRISSTLTVTITKSKTNTKTV